MRMLDRQNQKALEFEERRTKIQAEIQEKVLMELLVRFGFGLSWIVAAFSMATTAIRMAFR